MTGRYTIVKRAEGWLILSPLGEPLRMRSGYEYTFAYSWQALSFAQTFGLACSMEEEAS